jgi:hypothetical protein
MRSVAIVALGVAAFLVSGCITFSGEPTPTASPAPTEIPMVTPPLTPAPTPAPTEGPPTPTPDPNATPRPTPIDVAPYLTSEVAVVNLADVPLSVTVTLLDPDSTEEFTIGTFELQPEQATFQSVIPTLYRLDFGFSGVDDAGTCEITIGDAEQVQFAVISTGIVVTTSGGEPADPAEMVVTTSSRCRAGAGA